MIPIKQNDVTIAAKVSIWVKLNGNTKELKNVIKSKNQIFIILA